MTGVDFGGVTVRQEIKIAFMAKAPLFTSVAEQIRTDPQARTGIVEVYKNRVGGEVIKVAEREVILDFDKYLAELERLLEGKPASLKQLQDLKAGFGYIGVEEYAKAAADMADMIFADWAKDGRVEIYCPGNRSEALISSMVLEKLRDKWDLHLETLGRGNYVDRKGRTVDLYDTVRFAVRPRADGGHDTIWVLDDFICSGTRLRSSGQQLFDKLLQRGVDPDIAAKTIKIAVVAAPVNKCVEVYGDEVGRGDESWQLTTHSFYEVQKVSGSFTRAAFTGILCPLDYTFTELLLPLEQEAGIVNGHLENNRTITPMLMRVVRPYDSKTSGYKERWRSVEQ